MTVKQLSLIMSVLALILEQQIGRKKASEAIQWITKDLEMTMEEVDES